MVREFELDKLDKDDKAAKLKSKFVLKFHIQCLYFNPLKPEGSEWVPFPAGIKLKLYDYDPASANDLLGEGETDGEKAVFIGVKKTEEKEQDIFFTLVTNNKYINLETNTLVDKIENPSKFPFIALPKEIESRTKKDQDGKEGYLDDYNGKGEGTADKPWTFKMEDIRAFIQLKYYQDSAKDFKPLPKGLVVSAYDYDWLSRDDLQAVGCVHDDGKVYLPIFVKDEDKPDIYFNVNNPNKNIFLDKKDSKYTNSGNPNEQDRFVKLPEEWESKDNLDTGGKEGIKENFDGQEIASWSSPWEFHYIGGIEEIKWGKTEVIPHDETDKANMKVKLEVKTKSIKDETEAVAEIYKYKNGGNPTLYKKLEDLEIKGDKLVDDDGNVPEFKFEWHKKIWEYKRTQFFYKVKIDPLIKSVPQAEADMLRLKHYDSIVSVTDAAITGTEGTWVDNYLKTKGPWWEATAGVIKQDGHETHYISRAKLDKDDLVDLLERNKFLHHQDSHGSARCDDHIFSSPRVKKTTTVGADGVREWFCPDCKNNTHAIGYIHLNDNTNFYIDDVEDLDQLPKILVLAACCLTAITDKYPKAWLKKGVQWYIGWAVPVGIGASLNFSKAFYRRWCEHYKMDPSKIGNAFNDVQAPFANARPRIYQK